jgi:thioredoxin-related protein
MNIVRFILLVGAIIIGLNIFNGQVAIDIPAPLTAKRQSQDSGISKTEFERIINAKRSLASLAEEDYYTVIEVYLDSCPLCRQLETGFKPFLDKRQDVVIKRVHFPEDGIQFSFNGTNQAEVEAQAAEMNNLIQSFNVCGTPHVMVFGPDSSVLAADNCTQRDGTRFLQTWINKETGLLPNMLKGITRI